MVFAVTYRTKSDLSGINKLKDLFKYINSKSAYCGVLNADEITTKAAEQSQFGKTGAYNDGPFAGQTVKAPPRRFVSTPIANKKRREAILGVGFSAIKDSLTKNTIDKGLVAMAKKTTELQKNLIINNGEDVVGWKKHNEYRTIITKKGLDKPLYTRRNATFPISYEIGKRGQ